MKIDTFVRRKNVARYRRLIDDATKKTERQRIGQLLVEEQQERRETEDPENGY